MMRWFTGTPHAGWWLTRLSEDKPAMWRWWSGERWSVGFMETVSVRNFSKVNELALIPEVNQDFEWSTYCPEKPAVPRLDPTGLKQPEIDHFYSQAHRLQDAVNRGDFIYADLVAWRYFNGKNWSMPARASCTELIDRVAFNRPAWRLDKILWTDESLACPNFDPSIPVPPHPHEHLFKGEEA